MRLTNRVFSVCLALALASFAFVPAPAQAQDQHVLLTACNDTTFAIWVAAAEPIDLDSDGLAKGWWKVEAGACRYVGSYWTDAEGFYVYANAADGSNWSGSTKDDDYYCVDPNNAFSLDDAWRKNSYDSCPSGYTLKFFRFVHSPSGYGDNENFNYTYRFHM